MYVLDFPCCSCVVKEYEYVYEINIRICAMNIIGLSQETMVVQGGERSVVSNIVRDLVRHKLVHQADTP